MFVSGFFSPEEQLLAVAKKGKDSFETLMHEFCHFIQWEEQCKDWTNCSIEEYDAEMLIDLWMRYIIELNKKQLNKYIDLVRNVEMDCEKRVIKFAIDWDYPLDIGKYVQKANSYLYFYTVVKKCRKWSNKGCAPYTFNEIVSEMPTHFANDYNRMSDVLVSLYKKECLGE